MSKVLDVLATGRKLAKGRKGKVTVATVNSARRYVTIALGCGIPLFCLACSHLGGSLIGEGSVALGVLFIALCATCLSVSLSHLAWAIRDITRSAPWQSWALAVIVDVSIVACELMAVAGHDSLVKTFVMVAVTLFSMVLNCWAFLGHKSK